MRDLLPEHLQLVAEKWNLHFTKYMSVEEIVEYLRELIIRFDGVGVFSVDNPDKPIAWCFRKKG